jgi:hypothetical protein
MSIFTLIIIDGLMVMGAGEPRFRGKLCLPGG